MVGRDRYDARSAIEIQEDELARFFFRRSPRAFPFLTPLDHTLFCVEPPAIEGEDTRGDIDILRWYRFAPEMGIAVECKRVKYADVTFDGVLPNKLGALQKGARQVERLAGMGFHQTWLVVFAVVDGRGRTDFNFAFRGWTDEMRQLLETKLDQLELPEESGLLLVELTQPIDKELFDAAAVGHRVFRKATGTDQPPALTEWITGLNHIASQEAEKEGLAQWPEVTGPSVP